MTRLLPYRPAIDHTPLDRAVVELDSEDSTAVLSAIGAETARSVLGSLHEEPATISDLAEAVDSSIQNVQYHLEKLRQAGLVTVVGEWYSSKGRPMAVYAPTSERLVFEVRTGNDHGSDAAPIPASTGNR